jgi:hypothetical protein
MRIKLQRTALQCTYKALKTLHLGPARFEPTIFIQNNCPHAPKLSVAIAQRSSFYLDTICTAQGCVVHFRGNCAKRNFGARKKNGRKKISESTPFQRMETRRTFPKGWKFGVRCCTSCRVNS